MSEIKLTGKTGRIAVVDARDLARLSVCPWWPRTSSDGRVYAVGKPGGGRAVTMHEFLLGKRPGMEIDHRDGDGLNNRRRNMRHCRHADNMKNRRKNRNSASQFKGVWFDKGREVWKSAIECDGARIELGAYGDERVAAQQYDRAARIFHGEFARTNEMLGLL